MVVITKDYPAHPYSSLPTPNTCILFVYSSTKLPTANRASLGILAAEDEDADDAG
jgi:hypothetical protein